VCVCVCVCVRVSFHFPTKTHLLSQGILAQYNMHTDTIGAVETGNILRTHYSLGKNKLPSFIAIGRRCGSWKVIVCGE